MYDFNSKFVLVSNLYLLLDHSMIWWWRIYSKLQDIVILWNFSVTYLKCSKFIVIVFDSQLLI